MSAFDPKRTSTSSRCRCGDERTGAFLYEINMGSDGTLRSSNHDASSHSDTARFRRGNSMMDRRRFVGTLAGGLAIARTIGEAQSAAKVYRVGFLLGASGESVASLLHALEEGLRELGLVEGSNFVLERRYAECSEEGQ